MPETADGGADAAAPDAAPPTLSDICDQTSGLYELLISKGISCAPELELFLGGTPAASDIAMACSGSLQPYLDDGSITLGSAADLAACRDYLENVTCAEFEFDASSPCDGVIVGTVAAGGVCDDDGMCAGDSFCDKGGGTGCGACAARKADGASCTDNKQCANRRCADDGTCRAFGADGDSCATRDDCLGDLRCDTTLHCHPEPAWAVGTACGADFLDCDSVTGDLYCDPATSLCAPFVALGGDCSGGQLCRLFDYEHCATTGPNAGTCIPGTQVPDGQTCGFFEGRRCMTGSRCLDPDGDGGAAATCVREKQLGQACDETLADCEFLLECVGGTCQYGNYTGMCP